jgi:hypothetical protein
MHLEAFPGVFYLVTYGLAVVVLGILAKRKYRNPLTWGLIGGLFGPCSLIYLVFLPCLCPKCKAACEGKVCPNCDAGMNRVLIQPAKAPLLNAV